MSALAARPEIVRWLIRFALDIGTAPRVHTNFCYINNMPFPLRFEECLHCTAAEAGIEPERQRRAADLAAAQTAKATKEEIVRAAREVRYRSGLIGR